MRDFYLELNSAGSANEFPGNKNYAWTNTFSDPITLYGTWECALTECSMVPSVQTLDYVGKIEIFDFLFVHPTTPPKYGRYIENVQISKGHYGRSQDLADEINRVIGKKVPRLEGKKIFHYSKITQKFYVDIPNSLYVSIFIFGQLLFTLGATKAEQVPDEDFVTIGHDKEKSFYMFDGQKRFFYDGQNEWKTNVHGESSFDYLSQLNIVDCYIIYSNLVAPTNTSEGHFSILRTCAIKHNDSDSRVIEIFTKPEYLPLSRNHFESISVQLNTVLGTHLPLQGGFVRLRLHFRPRKVN